MRDEALRAKTLEQQSQGAWPQIVRILGRGQISKPVGFPVMVWMEIEGGEGKSLEFYQGGGATVTLPTFECAQAHCGQSQWRSKLSWFEALQVQSNGFQKSGWARHRRGSLGNKAPVAARAGAQASGSEHAGERYGF
jgi:hypothetical protein